MLNFLFQLSDFSIFLVLTCITILISVILIIISKRYIFYRLRYRDNPTIASISSLIGIIYGVLSGFIALYLIDNNDHASDAVLREANAVANVYLDSQWLKEPAQISIQNELKRYLDKVINLEWPLMREGKDADMTGDLIIQKMVNTLKGYPARGLSDSQTVQNVLTELKSLYNARHERINISLSELSPELWVVILVGTILIIGINYAFRVNLYVHLFGISAFAIMAASMLFLLVTLDRPFQGEFNIQPDAFRAVLEFMKANGHS